METSQSNEAVAAACDALDKLSDLVANTTISASNADVAKAINDQQPLSQIYGLCFDSVLLYNKPSLLQHHGT